MSPVRFLLRWCTVAILFLALPLVLSNCACGRAADPATPEKPKAEPVPAIGSVAPEIEGVDLDGVPFKLSDYRGQVVVLDFWGDW